MHHGFTNCAGHGGICGRSLLTLKMTPKMLAALAYVSAVIFTHTCTLLQGQDRSLIFTLHGLAGLVPEPVRHYCANVRCIVEAQEATADPMRLLRGLYPSSRPEELSRLAAGYSGKQLLPETLKMKLVDQIVEHVITGQEIRHSKWTEVCEASTAQVPDSAVLVGKHHVVHNRKAQPSIALVTQQLWQLCSSQCYGCIRFSRKAYVLPDSPFEFIVCMNDASRHQ